MRWVTGTPSWAFGVRSYSVSEAQSTSNKTMIDIKDSSKTVIRKSDPDRQKLFDLLEGKRTQHRRQFGNETWKLIN